jgi:hypothetical protein
MVESGSRYLVEDMLNGLYDLYPNMRFDLLTCYAGLPKGFRPERGDVFRVTDYPRGEGRARLFSLLRQRHYTVVGIVCSGEPIMTKWKWLVAARIPAKIFVLNENGDYFWVDYSNWKTVRHFVLFRAGLAGAGAVRTLARLVLFPFTLTYLLLYAGTVHLRRWLRT